VLGVVGLLWLGDDESREQELSSGRSERPATTEQRAGVPGSAARPGRTQSSPPALPEARAVFNTEHPASDTRARLYESFREWVKEAQLSTAQQQQVAAILADAADAFEKVRKDTIARAIDKEPQPTDTSHYDAIAQTILDRLSDVLSAEQLALFEKRFHTPELLAAAEVARWR
jgi:hypothetical protein